MFRAPGRINLVGEHTDYNQGLVLPAALDLFSWAAAAIERDGQASGPGYLRGVAWALTGAGLDLRGCDLLVGGNLPLGGGLSSSASAAAS